MALRLVRLFRTFVARTISSLSHLSGWQRSKNRSLSSHIHAFALRAHLLSRVTAASLYGTVRADPTLGPLTTATLSLPEYPAIYGCQKHRGHLFMKRSLIKHEGVHLYDRCIGPGIISADRRKKMLQDVSPTGCQTLTGLMLVTPVGVFLRLTNPSYHTASIFLTLKCISAWLMSKISVK